MQRLPLSHGLFAEPAEASQPSQGMAHHAVICGYGRVARELAEALDARGLRYLVIEYNPEIARGLRDQGVPVIYGDAANPAVLEHAHLERRTAAGDPDARTQAPRSWQRATRAQIRVWTSSPAAAASATWSACVRQAPLRSCSPSSRRDKRSSACALRRFGVGGLELSNLITGRRAAYYRRMAEDEPG